MGSSHPPCRPPGRCRGSWARGGRAASPPGRWWSQAGLRGGGDSSAVGRGGTQHRSAGDARQRAVASEQCLDVDQGAALAWELPLAHFASVVSPPHISIVPEDNSANSWPTGLSSTLSYREDLVLTTVPSSQFHLPHVETLVSHKTRSKLQCLGENPRIDLV